MVGAADIVADRLRRVTAEEDGPGIADALGEALRIAGDDLEMLRAADRSYAMADAHPDVAAVARHRAPSNAEAGVVSVLERLLAVGR